MCGAPLTARLNITDELSFIYVMELRYISAKGAVVPVSACLYSPRL